MNAIFEQAKVKYIRHKGEDKYNKLYKKICNSSTLNELCGMSAQKQMPPSAGDFIYKASLMPSIYITFDEAVSSMAALIMLKLWNESINERFGFCQDYRLEEMARYIVSKSSLLM